tara:strand:- start:1401 stop:2993 length:1593 start_codon:yes stop_codon:yes gene_type:complete
MEDSGVKNQLNKKVSEITFPVPFPLGEIKKIISIYTNTTKQLSKGKIIDKAIRFHREGNIPEAIKYYQHCIDKGFSDQRVFSNYGIIFQDQGKLKEAEIFIRKAIELKPDFAEAHSNLGNTLKDLGKLKEAEISFCKAIELNPDLSEAHSNLGRMFIDIGKLKEAEISIRKAIELDPDFAEAHSNLGVILKDLGKLKEAEISIRKAIELKPYFLEAHFNLGMILKDLGKLEELILFSNSILELKSVDDGYKLLALLRITIANLIQGNFTETFLNINKTNELISKGKINTIKDEKNRKHASTFAIFITSLYPLLDKENKNKNLEKIPHFGESNCLSFAHQTLSIFSKLKKIRPVLITGGKAWHFANKKNNQWKDSLTQQMKNHTYSDKAFISFGQIDCNKYEGILPYATKTGKDISEVCEKTVIGFMDYMELKLSKIYSKRYYFGVPAPTKIKELSDELDIKIIDIVKLYNSILKKEVLSRGAYFLDVYNLTSAKDGVNNNFYMCDSVHLEPKCLAILFKNHLYKPKNFIK